MAKNESKIEDYISGIEVSATPEEIEAVQVFSIQLVEDYGYDKSQIQTRPQFRVKARPSDTRKEYPVDIAVFSKNSKNDDDLLIIVECKKKNRKDGESQLEDYLRLSKAEIGVWFNGNERIFIRKIEKGGKVLFEKIPNIPKKGQTLSDIGALKREDLKPTHNLKAIFKSIRNYLAANTIGATRDEVLAQQLINLIFCKIYDEKYTKKKDSLKFRASIEEDPGDVLKRISNLFNELKTMPGISEVIDASENIILDSKSIQYVVGELQNYCLMESERDVIADAFETFIGHALKGGQGQFFTPRNVVKMLVEILNPTENDKIIDPACGSGGFLIDALKHVWQLQDEKQKEYGWSNNELQNEKMRVAIENFRGIDKDYFLSKVTKAYMALIGDGKGGIFCEDSLENPKNWKSETRNKIKLNSFDVILTNPPFGSKIPVSGEEKLKQYELAHKWKYKKEDNIWIKEKLKDKEAPQILFIERCLELLKEGGRMGLVLPDGIFGNDQLGYIRELILKKCRLIAVIDIPIETFMPNTGTKTSILVLQKNIGSNNNKNEDYPIFMAIAEHCGHDRRGNETSNDDISILPLEFHKWAKKNKVKF
jgi:type I restriction enzyme M protein